MKALPSRLPSTRPFEPSGFIVLNEFIDRHLEALPDVALKVYLRVMRCETRSTYPDVSYLADFCDCAPESVHDALAALRERGLLTDGDCRAILEASSVVAP